MLDEYHVFGPWAVRQLGALGDRSAVTAVLELHDLRADLGTTDPQPAHRYG
jgi:hypothetical protein